MAAARVSRNETAHGVGIFIYTFVIGVRVLIWILRRNAWG
jgi:hypothetical protein